jgi:glycosyltransferase involved in cell wall biosynthesis
MKILMIANIRLPTERAHGIQIMKTCEALSRNGAEIELVVPKRINTIKEDVFSYYGINKNFSINYLTSSDLINWGRIGAAIQALTFALSCVFLATKSKSDVLYSRNLLPLFILSFVPGLRKKLVWESHMGHWGFMASRVVAKSPLIVITHGLANFYIAKGIPQNHIHVSPDAVEIEMFDIPISKAEARFKLGWPTDKKIVLYTGHLYDWKGAHILAEAGKEFKTDTEIIFVGGLEGDIVDFKKQFGGIESVKILGKKPHKDIPLMLKAADVLVLPNSAKREISSRFTSPMKLFEYMAAQRPIIASDLPSLREVLDEKSAVFFIPDDPHSLAGAIKKLLSNTDLMNELAKKGRENVQSYTWDSRTKNIITFLKNELPS